ncbi:MAG TPA: extracellular solute-binding protein [Conexibacter sp.]|jgi:raffinose/stachyose/melibiose transport system substrate-binding protein|nr:extracellular solute-binding protein [Conexibacter sp.]
MSVTIQQASKLVAGVACAGMLAVLVGCGGTPSASNGTSTQSSGNIKTGAAAVRAAGKYTLEVTDLESETGRRKTLDEVNRAFERKYPNITVHRIPKAYADYLQSVKLTLQGSNVPCVAMGDQGRDTDGPLVQAGLIRPLDAYTKAYHWPVFATSQWSDGGRTWGKGANYSVSPFFQVVGLFYNKALMRQLGIQPPRTFDELVASLDAAKKAGITPLGLGNIDRFAATFHYELLQNQLVDKQTILDFIFHLGTNPTFELPADREAAQMLREWAAKGYFTPGFDGVSPTDAVAQFATGKSLYYLSGQWDGPTVLSMGSNAGFMLPPGPTADAPAMATGGLGGPWHITSKCDKPDVAAAYLDFLIGPEAQRIVAASGDLPSRNDVSAPSNAAPVVKDFYTARDQLVKDGGVIPFEDVTNPGFGNAFDSALQELMAQRISAKQFVDQVQASYSGYFGK